LDTSGLQVCSRGYKSMPVLAGFHAEGNDHLILHAFAAKLLGLGEDAIAVDFIDSPGRGWHFVLDFLPNALKRFYGKCAQFAVIGIDNDGNTDLDQTGLPEDPAHPRHDRHPGETLAACRRCQLAQLVDQLRAELHWVPKKPGATWPVLIAVPVEMIETWLLIVRGSPNIHRKPRSIQKQLLYGRPVATGDDVRNIAIPLVRGLTAAHIDNLRAVSPSFLDFHEQIETARAAIIGDAECW